jgi:putative DNA modification/repair radical SAM protein
MDVRDKLAILADAAKYDASCASSGSRRANAGGLGNSEGVGICHSYTPDGRCVSLLKVLLTNYCIFDCKFCINRITSDVRRARFTIDEVVWLTMAFYRRNYIEGLFLSSGIIQSPDYTMEQLAEIGRRLREDERFFGYIHLKAVPGASEELIDKAGRHADRLSANVELPRDEDLRRLAPEKSMRTVELTMSAIRDRHSQARADARKRIASARFAPAGQSTQLVVGATDASDRTTLARATHLYSTQKLRRVYYSAFSPIPSADAKLPAVVPPLVREHRLYQADWLVRKYGFSAEELTTDQQPDLDLKIDPKLGWALRHREFFPVDVNVASREAILRIPGIGVRNAKRIVEARRFRTLRLADLKRLRIALNRAGPFIVAADHHPDLMALDSPRLRQRVAPENREQLDLFAAATSARTGEL